MKGWILGVMLSAAAIFVVGGVVLLSGPQSGPISGFVAAEDGKLFPELSARMSDVETIEIEDSIGGLALEKSGDGWRIANFDGYPARNDAVDAFLETLAGLEVRFVHENDSPQFGRFDVAEPSDAHGGGILVAARDGNGRTLAEGIVGHTLSVPGESQEMTYFRRNGDERVWLANQPFRPPSDPLSWSQETIVNVPRTKIANAVVVRPDGKKIVVRRDDESGQYTAEGLVQDAQDDAEGAAILNKTTSALESVRFEDVRDAKAIRNDTRRTTKITMNTDDAIAYRIDVRAGADARWAEFSAEVQPENDTPAKDGAKRAAERFNERHNGWAYRLAAYAEDRFMSIGRETVEDEEILDDAQDPAAPGAKERPAGPTPTGR